MLRLLGVEPDYLPSFIGIVSVAFGPQIPKGGCGGACPPTIAAGGSRPLGKGSGAVPLKGIFYEKCLVKYCNFVVNLDHSLYHKYDNRSCVNLRVSSLRRQPSIIYEGIVLCLCSILREESERE